MTVIVCENITCKYISKRKTKIMRCGDSSERLCHTCKADLIKISSIATGDESIKDYLGYIPYECIMGKNYD